MSDEDLSRHLRDAIELFEAKGLEIISLLPAVSSSFEERDEQLKELRAQVEELQTELSSTKIAADVLRSEWKEMVVQTEVVDSVLAEATKDLLQSLRDHALLVLSMTDKDSSLEDLDIKVKKMSRDDLQRTIESTDTSEGVKLVRSGLSAEPTKEVSIADATPVEINTREDGEKEFLDRVKHYADKYGKEWALRFVDGQARRGNIVNEEVLAKALKLMAE